jgi:hypothetical protein
VVDEAGAASPLVVAKVNRDPDQPSVERSLVSELRPASAAAQVSLLDDVFRPDRPDEAGADRQQLRANFRELRIEGIGASGGETVRLIRHDSLCSYHLAVMTVLERPTLQFAVRIYVPE